MKSPFRSLTPLSVTSVTGEPVLITTLRPRRRSAIALAMRSGSAGKMRSAASISVILMSFSGSMLVETVGDEAARGLVQLGRKLGAGRACADDRHVQLAGPDGLSLRKRAHAGVDAVAG